MGARWRWRPGLLAAALPVLLILLGLGVWQGFVRLPAKLALLERETANLDAPAIALDLERALAHGQPVELTAQLDPDHALFVRAGNLEGRGGGLLVAPLSHQGQTLWLVLGWLPRTLEGDLTGLIPETAFELEAYLQLPAAPTRRPFQPRNDPDANIWVQIDPRAFSAASGLDADTTASAWLHMRAPNLPGAWPRLVPPAQGLSNNHLVYAVTWFTLAGALLLMLLMLSRTTSDEDT